MAMDAEMDRVLSEGVKAMSEANQLTGLPMWQAVVRVRHKDAYAWHDWMLGERGYKINASPRYARPIIAIGPTKLKAWHDAARQEINAAGYSVYDSPRGWTWFMRGEERDGFSTRDLAEQSAMQHYVRGQAASQEQPTKPTLEQVAAQMAEALDEAADVACHATCDGNVGEGIIHTKECRAANAALSAYKEINNG